MLVGWQRLELAPSESKTRNSRRRSAEDVYLSIFDEETNAWSLLPGA